MKLKLSASSTKLYKDHLNHQITVLAKGELARRIDDNNGGGLRSILLIASQILIQDAILLCQIADEFPVSNEMHKFYLEHAHCAFKQGNALHEMGSGKSILV